MNHPFRMVLKETLHIVLIRNYNPRAVREFGSERKTVQVCGVQPQALVAGAEVALLDHPFISTSRYVMDMEAQWVV